MGLPRCARTSRPLSLSAVEIRREAYLSTVQTGPQAAPRVPRAHGHRGRPQGVGESPGQGPPEAFGLAADNAMAPSLAPAPTRLKRRADFLRIAARGQKAAVHGLVLQVCVRPDDRPAAIGFTVTKKVGNAVVRNRTKRRLRAAARAVLDTVSAPGVDMVLIGRGETRSRPFLLLVDDLRRTMTKLGALK